MKAEPKEYTMSKEEPKKLYEWIMSDKREPAQTYFSSGVIRNIAKEIEFREEKHKEEMEKFAEWIRDDKWQGFLLDSWVQIDGNGNQTNIARTTTELIEMFKKEITANG